MLVGCPNEAGHFSSANRLGLRETPKMASNAVLITGDELFSSSFRHFWTLVPGKGGQSEGSNDQFYPPAG